MGEISEAVKIESGINMSKVAAITAALVAGGFLGEGEKITGIRRKGGMNPWKKSGLVKHMLGRDLSIDTNSL
jgi:hypothetical protein